MKLFELFKLFLAQNLNSDAVTSSDPAYPSRHGGSSSSSGAISGSGSASSSTTRGNDASSQMVLPLQLSQPPIAVLFPSPVTADGMVFLLLLLLLLLVVLLLLSCCAMDVVIVVARQILWCGG